MNRNNKAFFTEPYLSNLAGWSEGKIQLDPFPRDGSFKNEDMRAAKDMIFGSWGDPGWSIDYMKDAYKAWMKMKTYWDKGPELKKQDSSLSQSQLKPDASLPPYECVVSAEIPKPLTNRLYPQLPSTTEVFPFVQLPDGYKITPLSVTEAVAICKDLPDPARSPHQFVAVLQRLTAYSQLTGRDYRFILTKTLPAEITEEEMIEEVDYLNPVYDTPPVRRVVSKKAGDSKPLDLSKPSRVLLITDSEDEEEDAFDWVWASSGKLKVFFKQLTAFLIKVSSAKQDISHAANTKQRTGESPVAFFNRFKHAWVEESAIPIEQNCPLFLNTFLNNMNKDTAQLIRITTPNITNISVDELGRRLRELSSAGAFDVSRGKTPAMLQVNAAVNPRPQQFGNGRRCFYCGKPGHLERDCRKKAWDLRQRSEKQKKKGSGGGLKQKPPLVLPSAKTDRQNPVYPISWQQ